MMVSHFHKEIVHNMVAYMVELMNKITIKYLLVVKLQLIMDPKKVIYLKVSGHLDKNHNKDIVKVTKQKEDQEYQAP